MQLQLLGSVLSLTGTALATAYTAGAAFQPGRAKRVRFYAKSLRTAGSGATTTTIKLQFRYNDGSVTTDYMDLPSNTDAAPSVHEIEHAFSTAANDTTEHTFYLDRPESLLDVTCNLKVNSAGQTTDNTTVYAVAYLD